MIYGRSVIWWVIAVIVAVLIFVVVKWLLLLVAASLHIAIPDAVASALAALVAIGAFYGGWRQPA